MSLYTLQTHTIATIAPTIITTITTISIIYPTDKPSNLDKHYLEKNIYCRVWLLRFSNKLLASNFKLDITR